MRKKFIYVVLIPLILISTIVYIFHNRWIESGIEYAAEEVVGAKVEIENLQLNLSPLGIQWDKITVANPNDPWMNIFETGTVKFGMDFNQLLRGKYIIDELTVENMVLGTKRSSEGSIGADRKKRAILAGDKWTFSKIADDAFKNTVTATPLFDLAKLKRGFNADSLLGVYDIKTVKHIDSLKTQINEMTNQWSSIKTDFDNHKQKVIELGKQVAAINPSELNNVQNITSAITTVDNATKTINEVTQLVNSRSASVRNNIKVLAISVGEIDDYVKSDFGKLKNLAHLPSINTKGMAQILVGSEMYKRAKNYLYWVDEARNNIKKYESKPEYESPPRMKGQDIKFPEERGYPKLWIKKVTFSGSTGSTASSDYFFARGGAFNVSDNQKLSGAPISVSLEGTENNRRSLKLSGLFDRRGNIPLDQINASLSGVPVGDFSLGNSSFLPSKVTNAIMSTELKISVPGNKIDATARFNLKNVSLKFESEPKNMVENLVREVLSGINEFNVSLRMWNTGGSFDIALATDLDDKLTQKVSAVLGDEIAKLQNELQRKFDALVNDEIRKFNSLYESKLKDVQNQLGDYETLFADKLNIVDGKKQELLAQLDKQKKGFLEDKLKGLFKK